MSTKPLVSVVVPVYNSEAGLGYCINSLVSQTYPRLEIILVNDGSTDGSANICQNYAAVDSRVKVINQENAGVSTARNRGVEIATGTYITFVDSDDVVSQSMIEILVNTAEGYGADLAICGALQINFDNPRERGLIMGIGNVFGNETVMDGDFFRGNLMRLVAHTYVMECPWAKLFRLDLWKSLQVSFPEDMTLGEDFMANMDFYWSCNRVAFIDEKCYYYNIAPKESALTRVFRKNLFENQLRIMEKLERFLQFAEFANREEDEAAEFACYANTHFTRCIQNIINAEGIVEETERKRIIADILNSPLARKCAQLSSWWIPGTEKLREYYNSYDVLGILNFYAEKVLQEKSTHVEVPPVMDNAVIVQTDEEAYRRSVEGTVGKGFMNRVVRRIIRTIAKFVPERTREKMMSFEECIFWHGIKYAFVNYGKV